MKKQIALATTAAALLSTGAYASKARMEALGQDSVRGSYFMSDTRGVFSNPAGVVGMSNYVITEWGSSNAGADSVTAPNPEGGIFKNMGSFTYGLYFGADVGAQNGIRTGSAGYGGSSITMGSANMKDRANELDLFIGGDMGVEWGARVTYAKSTAGFDQKNSALGLGLGMNMGDLGAYLNLGLNDESSANTTGQGGEMWEADTAINVGVSYMMGAWTFYGEYDTVGAEYTSSTGVAKNETSQKTITLGAGHTHEVSSTSAVFTEVRYENVTGEDKDGTTSTNNTELKSSRLPITIGYEADATSWLTLRGSITQRVLLDSAKTEVNSVQTASTMSDSTDVAAGATLNFGKLKVDGSIGTDDLNTGDGTNAQSENGNLRLDRLMTRVAVHYWF